MYGYDDEIDELDKMRGELTDKKKIRRIDKKVAEYYDFQTFEVFCKMLSDMTDEELDFLIDDIFLYFGLGCRNVSKLWIEKGFELSRIFEASEKYNRFFQHSKYMNNYDYQRTLLLLNRIEHLSNNFLMLKPDKGLFSAISVLHYEIFEDEKEFKSDLELHKEIFSAS